MAHQVSPGGYINYYNEPAFQLAVVEHVAEEQSDHDLAAHALAGWALCSASPCITSKRRGTPLLRPPSPRSDRTRRGRRQRRCSAPGIGSGPGRTSSTLALTPSWSCSTK